MTSRPEVPASSPPLYSPLLSPPPFHDPRTALPRRRCSAAVEGLLLCRWHREIHAETARRAAECRRPCVPHERDRPYRICHRPRIGRRPEITAASITSAIPTESTDIHIVATATAAAAAAVAPATAAVAA